MGTLISWIATCLGSFLCYLVFFFLEDKVFYNLFHGKRVEEIRSSIYSFQKITLSELVLIITLPFTPSFLVNIICGISKVSYEKFLVSLLIGKLFMIIFWGYIGSSFLKSLTDIYSLLYIVIALDIAYLLSNYVGRKMNIK